MGRARVLHLITHLGVGGATDNTLLTVAGLSRSRYEVHLGAGTLDAGDEYTDWTPRGREAADALFLVPHLVRDVDPRRDLRALRALTDLIRAGSYDLVHTHCAKAGVLGRLAAHRAGVPAIVHTFHCLPWKVGADPSRTGLRRLKEDAKGALYVWIERYTARSTDAIITVAEANREEAIRMGLAPAGKIRTIPSGLDVERFTVPADRAGVRRDLGVDPASLLIGWVGRLSVQKDPVTFVRAARIALAGRPDLRFVLVGDGPLRSEVDAERGGDERIVLTGYRDDVPGILRALDFFALSSIWEGLGRSLTEALLVGLPVACTAVDGVPELVRDGVTGLLCPPHSPERMAESILRLVNDPAAARRMGERGREQVRGSYTSAAMIRGIEEVYAGLLGRRSARAA